MNSTDIHTLLTKAKSNRMRVQLTMKSGDLISGIPTYNDGEGYWLIEMNDGTTEKVNLYNIGSIEISG